MSLKILPILVIIYLFLNANIVCAQTLPPLLLLTIEEIGNQVDDDSYFDTLLAEDTNNSGISDTHGSPSGITGNTQKKTKTTTQLEDYKSREKSMREKFEKRQTEMSKDFLKRRNQMSERYFDRLTMLKKKHLERYELWDRYVKRYFE